MADTNEEQLLTDLLRCIAREDARLEAPHLEPRVIEALDSAFARSIQPSFHATRMGYLVIAAAFVVAALVPALFWSTPQVSTPAETAAVEATEQSIAEPSAAARAVVPTRPASALRATASKPANPTNLTNLTNPTNPTNPTNLASADEFVPLMPMTEHELDGPFQIVRVQMPRASLGTLRSPLEHPNEVIEADVLLGEDGMARAIRVSASGSVYPWRSR